MLTIYGTPDCPACDQSKAAATEAKMPFSFVNLYENIAAGAMFSRRNFNRIPQIFMDENHLGGHTELVKFIQNSK